MHPLAHKAVPNLSTIFSNSYHQDVIRFLRQTQVSQPFASESNGLAYTRELVITSYFVLHLKVQDT
jgi:hypothetical protein